MSAFLAGFCGLDASLLRLGVGNCFDTVGVHAIAGLGLLELALGSQRVVAGYRADNFFRLAFHRVDQAFPRLTGLVMLRHLSLLNASIDDSNRSVRWVSFESVHGDQNGLRTS